MSLSRHLFPALVAALAASASMARAEIAVSAYDGKQVLADGMQVVPAQRVPDGVTLIELSGPEPRVLGVVRAPTSVIGPPSSVAVTPDEALALVTSARRVSPQDPTTQVPDDLVTVIDLKARAVVATLHAGAGASGVSIDPGGGLALVANRAEGTVSIFAIQGGRVEPAGKVTLGPAAISPAHVVFFDGGRRALVTRDGDHRLSVLEIEGRSVRVRAETLAPGLRPYQVDTAGPRRFAVTANIGGGGRDMDTLSLIDLAPATPRVIDVVAVGLTPEGVKMSPDGRHVAVTVNNGSNLPKASLQYHAYGLVQVWRIAEGRLVKVAEARAGVWGQGLAWSRDGRTLLAQSAAENRIEVFRFDGLSLRKMADLSSPAGPAAIRTAEP